MKTKSRNPTHPRDPNDEKRAKGKKGKGKGKVPYPGAYYLDLADALYREANPTAVILAREVLAAASGKDPQLRISWWDVRDRLDYRLACLGQVRDLIRAAPLAEVPLGELVATQATVSKREVEGYLLEPLRSKGRFNAHLLLPTELPVVVRVGGRLHVHDGHHRLTSQVFLGKEEGVAKLVDLDAAAAKGATTKVQSLVFEKKVFSRAKAIAWAKTHDFKSGDVDVTETSYRLRQRDPSRFDPDSFRTIKLTKGVSAVIGKLR